MIGAVTAFGKRPAASQWAGVALGLAADPAYCLHLAADGGPPEPITIRSAFQDSAFLGKQPAPNGLWDLPVNSA